MRYRTTPRAEHVRAFDRAVARLSRRDLLRIFGAVGAASLIAPRSISTLLAQQPAFGDYPFKLGVASGDPLPDGVVLWTRLAPKPLEGGGMPMTNVEVGWEIAEDQQFRTILQQGRTIARPELGHSVHVEVNGLAPGREYFYRFHAGTEVSQVARTKTAPAAGSAVDRIRYAVCGCAEYEVGHFTAYRHIADEAFDFVFHTGDYIYEYPAEKDDPYVVRLHTGDEIYTIVDYRNRFAQYKMEPGLMAAHHSAPFIVTFDDHETENNYAGDRDENGTPPELFLLRRAAAYQAYYESMPLRAATLPNGPHMRSYRHLVFGNLIDLSVLDTRQWRSDQACGDGNHSACAEASNPERTMLGVDQERWLFDTLGSAKATWTVLGQQVPSYMRDYVALRADGRFSMDKWDGYTAARSRLYGRLQEARTPNPIVLSGDVHMHFGADLKADFRDPRSATVGVEFTNTSITSTGDGAEYSPGWDKVKPDNPHIKFHSSRRGYIACTATPQTMRADFKIVEKVSVPDVPVQTAGSLVVEAGRPGAQLA